MTATKAMPGQASGRRAKKPLRPLTFLGVLSEMLVIAGLLVGGYFFWQMVWSDVQAAGKQEVLLQELDQHWQQPADTDAAPTLDPRIFATLSVPRWGEDYRVTIAEGESRDVVDNLGIGHFPWTQMPGEVGNFGISGHRTSHGKVFRNVDQLRNGDSLVVETQDAIHVYRVVANKIVSPRAGYVLDPVPPFPGAEPGGSYITLTTCHPVYGTSHRFVVWGVLESTTAKTTPPAIEGQTQ